MFHNPKTIWHFARLHFHPFSAETGVYHDPKPSKLGVTVKSSAADKSYCNCEISWPLSYFGFHNLDFIAEQNMNEKVFESHKAELPLEQASWPEVS